MILELDTERCAIKDIGPYKGVDGEIPQWLERNEVVLIGVWKPLSSRHVLKLWD